MGKEMKNIIVLKNIYSDFFEEVIFVLKKDTNSHKHYANSKNIVYEAREIVEDFINRNNKHLQMPKNNETNEYQRGKNINLILNLSLVLSVAMFILLIMKVW